MDISQEPSPYHTLTPINTLAIAKRLQASGMSQQQAETQAEIWGEIVTYNTASKTDIENMRKELKTDIENLRKELKTDIENLRKDTFVEMANIEARLKVEIATIKSDIFKWIVPLMLGQAAVFAGLVNVLVH